MTNSNENPALEGEETENTEAEEAENTEVEGAEITGGRETEVSEVRESLKTTKDEKSKERNEKTKGEKNERKCSSNKWNFDDQSLWRIYMMLFIDKQRKLKRHDKLERTMLDDLPRFPQFVSSESSPPGLECFPQNTFNQKHKAKLPSKLNRSEKIRIWRKMRSGPQADILSYLPKSVPNISKTDSEKCSGVWPCTKRKLSEERKYTEKMEDSSEDELKDDYADHKELGHARIPPTCPRNTKYLLVDRAAGENRGLVDGDYILFELLSKRTGKRIYANVCLRGLKGMHIVELSPRRAREKTWKFCFYQAVVALLAKTQLRYKFAWSVNVDYIYDHAWMLFLHMGYINIRRKQRLDDVVVYNYKYSIELELIHELKEIPRITDVNWDFVEKTLKKQHELERKELMHTPEVIGSEKNSIRPKLPVHKSTKEIEDWFDKLDLQYKNCIFRTTRFSLAFWKDGLYWYLYNPFRCDKFGFWDDFGYGCIIKFCSRDSLKRHLMILLLRAYVYEAHFEMKKDEADEQEQVEGEQDPKNALEEGSQNEENGGQGNHGDNSNNRRGLENNESQGYERQGSEKEEPELKKDVFTIQIFQIIYQCCKIHNIKLLQRGAPKSKMQFLPKKELDTCPEDSDELSDSCMTEEGLELDVSRREKIEKKRWLKTMTITWARFLDTKKEKIEKDILIKKLMWHQYYVEEEGKLFSLWGQVHIKDQVFPEENRGKQCCACYVVCAGMTRLMAPEYWSPRTLDAILFCGDGYYTSSVLEAEAKSRRPEYLNIECWYNYLSEYFKIGEFLFQARILPAICGKIYVKTNRYLWRALEQFFLKYRFGILTCENSCLGILKFCGAYYIFDVHSYGPPIFQYGTGTAYMLRATYFYKFMTLLILTIGSPECSQYFLNPIEILKIHDLDNVNCPEKNHQVMCREIKLNAKCPVNDQEGYKKKYVEESG